MSTTWRPEENEILVGQVLSKGSIAGQYGPMPTALLKCKDGSLVTVLLATVLLGQFREADVQPGEKVAIQYLGRHPEKGYHRYLFGVNRPGQREFHRLTGLHGHQPKRLPECDEAREARIAAAAAKLDERPLRPVLCRDPETRQRRKSRPSKPRTTPSSGTSERAAVLAVVRTQRLAPPTGPVSKGPAVADPADPFG